MTTAKPAHREARELAVTHLDMHPGSTAYPGDLDPAEVGIVGSRGHVLVGTSYHLGEDDLILSKRPYSVYESARDRNGLDEHASAMDFGWFRVVTPKGTFDLRHFSAWLVRLCRAGDPDTVDVREVIYSPDGKVVLRWDDLGIRSSGDDSHLTHTHVSEYRDADGHRMLRLVRRYLAEIGLLEDDMALTEAQDRMLTATNERVRALAAGLGSLTTTWAADSDGVEPIALVRQLARIEATLVQLSGRDLVDEQEIARATAPLVVSLLGTESLDPLEAVIRQQLSPERVAELAARLAASAS